MRYLFAVLLVGLSLSAGIVQSATVIGSELRADPVPLTDAISEPDYERVLLPGSQGTLPLQLAYRISDVSAYRWNGSALPAQRWTDHHTVSHWGRVAFDGRTFSNYGRQRVIVAAWKG